MAKSFDKISSIATAAGLNEDYSYTYALILAGIIDENHRIEEGDDFATKVGKKFDNAVDITKNAINNPSLITNTVAESLPSMLAGRALVPLLRRLGK